jgi:hypothetical protein
MIGFGPDHNGGVPRPSGSEDEKRDDGGHRDQAEKTEQHRQSACFRGEGLIELDAGRRCACRLRIGSQGAAAGSGKATLSPVFPLSMAALSWSAFGASPGLLSSIAHSFRI